MSKIISIRKNANGIDYFIGDIHGCFTELEAALNAIGFDRTRDRLFAIGDLVDRGEESYLVIEYANEPWFIPLCGNHDAMTYWLARALLLESEGKSYKNFAKKDWANAVRSGGSWLMLQSTDFLKKWVAMVEAMPIAIEYIDHDNTVLAGLIHAELQKGVSWVDLKKQLLKLDDDFVYSMSREEDDGEEDSVLESALWGRTREKSYSIQRARKGTAFESPADGKDLYSEGIPLVISGHTPVAFEKNNGPCRIENARLIDHGICRGNAVKLYRLEDLA